MGAKPTPPGHPRPPPRGRRASPRRLLYNNVKNLPWVLHTLGHTHMHTCTRTLIHDTRATRTRRAMYTTNCHVHNVFWAVSRRNTTPSCTSVAVHTFTYVVY